MTKEKQEEQKKTEEPKEPKLTAKQEKILKLKEVAKKEDEVFEKWKDSADWKNVSKNPVYKDMLHYLDMVSRGLSMGCIIHSRGGTGKTYTALQKMKSSKVNYSYMSGFTTPAGFYVHAYENRDADVLVLDDVFGLFEDKKCVSYLKAMTWENGGKRIVFANSTKNYKDKFGDEVPNAFEPTFRVIILTNQLNMKNPHVKAFMSRLNYIQLEIDNVEMKKIMEEVIQSNYNNMTLDERKMVYEHLCKVAPNDSSELNLRSLIRSFDFYKYSRDVLKSEIVWKELVEGMFGKQSESFRIARQVIKQFETDKQQKEEYMKLMHGKRGASVNTFYNHKKEIEQMTANA